MNLQKWLVIPILLLVYVFLFRSPAYARQGKNGHRSITLSGTFENGHLPDSVTLLYWDRIIAVDTREFTIARQISAKVNGGQFEFKLDTVRSGGFISLAYHQMLGRPHEYLSLYRIQAGDSIHLNISYRREDHELVQGDTDSTICFECYHFRFSGRGSMPYALRYALDEKMKALEAKYESANTQVTTGNITKDFWVSEEFKLNKYHSLREDAKKIVASYRDQLDKATCDQMETDVLTELGESYFRGYANTLFLLLKSPDFTGQKEAVTAFMKNYPIVPWGTTSKNLIESPVYTKYIIRRTRLQRILENDSLEYFMIKRTFKGLMQQRMLTAYMLDRDWSLSSENKAIVHADIQKTIYDPFYFSIIKKMIDEQNIGAKVYNFALQDRHGKTVRLSDLQGKVVFLDFWFVGCGNCVNYYKNIVSKVEQRYHHHPDLVFLTIATDVNKRMWIQGIESGEYTSNDAINLISDQGANHPLMKQFNISGVPHPIVIDRNGNLFNNSATDLKVNGIAGVSAVIEAALAQKAKIPKH